MADLVTVDLVPVDDAGAHAEHDPGAGAPADDRRVAVVTLTNPPLNALSSALLVELAAVARRLGTDPNVAAVLVTGAGERAFAAGADVTEFDGAAEARTVAAAFHDACGALESIPRPVVAAIRGYALGGGLEVAMACDLRVAADDARMGQPEILLGIVPGGGATQRLTRLVGPARAKELMWSGRQVDASEALGLGLVDRVEPADGFAGHALTWVRSFARGAVVAMGLAKRAVHAGEGRPLGEGLDAETEVFAEVFATDDARIGLESFREHGPGRARFSGR